ncbi:MAG: hypothetical protein ACPL0B_01935 [Anaerolineales bacterium]
MIIHPPQIELKEGKVILSADVEFSHSIQDMPKTLWFAFPEKYQEYVSSNCDAFASTLLPIAQLFGEDLEVRGEISPRLAYNLNEMGNSYYEAVPPRDFTSSRL